MEVEVCFCVGFTFAWFVDLPGSKRKLEVFYLFCFVCYKEAIFEECKVVGGSFTPKYSFIWPKSKWVQISFRLSWFGPPVWLAFYPIPFRFLSCIIILLHPHFSLLHVDLHSTFVNSFCTFEFYFSFYVSLHFCMLIQLLSTNLFVYVKYKK